MGKLLAWFSGAKNWIIAALAALSGALAIRLSFARSKADRKEKEAVEATHEAERKANKALLDGLEAEEAAENEKIDPNKRYFD